MDLTIRAVGAPGKGCQEVTVEALAHAIPAARVRQIAPRYRPAKSWERNLNVEATLWLVIGLHLSVSAGLGRQRVAPAHAGTQGVRHTLAPAPEAVLASASASASALVYRRDRLGVRPVAALFLPRRLPAPGHARAGAQRLCLWGLAGGGLGWDGGERARERRQ